MNDAERPVPPVWPLPIACGLAFMLALGLGLAYAVVLTLLTGPGLPTRADEFVGRFQQVLFSPAGFLGSVVVNATVLAGVAFLGVRLDREPWRPRLRLHATSIPPGHLAVAALGMLGVGQVLDSLLAMLGWSDAGMLGLMAEAVAAMRWPALVLAVLVMGPVAGTAEELFFRGFVQTRLRQRFGPRWAVAVTALVFGAFHCDPWHSPTAAIMGVYLGWVTERTGHLRPAIVAHVVNNALYVPIVVFGPKELSVPAHVGLTVVSAALAALAVAIFARAYPPAAARPALAAAPGAPPEASLE